MVSEESVRQTGGGSVTESGDESFVDYVRRRERSLKRTAYLLTGDVHQAEDLVQTTLTKLYAHWDDVRDPGSRDGYARRILVNTHNSVWRKPWRRREVASIEVVTRAADGADTDHDLADALRDLVSCLPLKQRTVIVLRYFEDLPIATIADLMGIAPGTVKSQANRALATLRAHPAFEDLEDWA